MEPEQPQKQDQENYWQPQDEATTPSSPQVVAKPSVVPHPSVKKAKAAEKPVVLDEDEGIVWEASDAVDHHRGPLWFISFILISLVAVFVTFYLQQWIFAALLLVAALAVVVIARRPARLVEYELNHGGIGIDDEFYPLSEFRTFGVVRDEAFFAIKLIPVKRFSPEVMIYFAEADGEKIVDILGAHLPMEEMKLDLADRIIRKIRL